MTNLKKGDLVEWPYSGLFGAPAWRGIVVKGPDRSRWPAPVVTVQWLIDDADPPSEHSTHVLKKLKVESA